MRMKPDLLARLALHRNIAPYATILVIFSVVTIGSLVLLKGKYNAEFFMGLFLLWVLVAAYLIIEAYYRISLDGGVLIQRAWMMKKVEIGIKDISGIELESGISKAGRVHRPYNRVAIYGHNDHGRSVFIDISLKHFLRRDIADLLLLIKMGRPDIEFSGHLGALVQSSRSHRADETRY